MAVRKVKELEYEIQGITTEISATSRCAISLNNNYYTIEATEKRTILSPELADMDKEWTDLFDCINKVTDEQVKDIINTFKK